MTEITKKKKVLPVIIISAVVLAGVAALAIYIFAIAIPKQNYSKAIGAGEKYLTEMDYDNAILAYEKAIEINPKGKEGYLGLADAYIGLTDYAKALKVLKDGYNETLDEEIREKMKEVKKMLEDETPKAENPNSTVTASSNNLEPEPVPEVDYSVYDDVLNTINHALTYGFDDYIFSVDYEINYEMQNPNLAVWGYCQTDIDGDGIDELIIAKNDNAIGDIYSIIDGHLVHPFGGGAGGSRYVDMYLTENDDIVTFVNGAEIFRTYKISKLYNGNEVVLEEIHEEPDSNNYELFHWYYSDGDNNQTEISEADAQRKIKEFEDLCTVNLNLTIFPYYS